MPRPKKSTQRMKLAAQSLTPPPRKSRCGKYKMKTYPQTGLYVCFDLDGTLWPTFSSNEKPEPPKNIREFLEFCLLSCRRVCIITHRTPRRAHDILTHMIGPDLLKRIKVYSRYHEFKTNVSLEVPGRLRHEYRGQGRSRTRRSVYLKSPI